VSRDSRSPLLVLVGETGSGKSDLALAIAARRPAEIVSADAFAVYRGLDIGTAKPPPAARATVPHHLVDVAEPTQTYSAGRWSVEARRAVEEIDSRGRLPIVVGGSGFYVAALLDGLPAGAARDEGFRARLAAWGKGREREAHEFLRVNDPLSASRIAPSNLRYTLRALEILLVTGRPPSQREAPPDRWVEKFRLVLLGLAPAREDLYARITERVRRMLDGGWDEEVRRLMARGVSPDSHAFQAIGYRDVAEWAAGRAGRRETEARIVAATRRFARRQRSWFGRERRLRWLKPEEALEAALRALRGADTETIE
jgi:tRNA dimethylallyltransferase